MLSAEGPPRKRVSVEYHSSKPCTLHFRRSPLYLSPSSVEHVFICTIYGCLLCENKVNAVLSENIACRNFLRFSGKKIILKSRPCKVCDKLHVCSYHYHDNFHPLQIMKNLLRPLQLKLSSSYHHDNSHLPTKIITLLLLR